MFHVDHPSRARLRIETARPRPFVARGIDWPVMSWTPERLAALAGDVTVRYLVYDPQPGGRNEDGLRTEAVPLRAFIERHVLQNTPGPSPIAPYVDEYNHRLLQVPRLRADLQGLVGVRPRDGVFGPRVVYVRAHPWIGPANTRSGLHRDHNAGLLLQVHGRKRVYLWSPSREGDMHPSQRFESQATISEVDVFGQELPDDLAMVPRLSVVLGPGDALFIPSRMWHAARSLEPSVSISLSGYTPYDLAEFGAHDVLHRLHLYRWGECACHGGGRRYWW
ncbi:MAG: cupin-like domain-containing protein [Myxococcales bacterium]|nr:cupin-like domain-containing protein [Myxococcales bacterium]